LPRIPQEEELAAGPAGSSQQQPTAEKEVEFMRAVQHGIHKAMTVRL
jgi:hypothetical protein